MRAEEDYIVKDGDDELPVQRLIPAGAVLPPPLRKNPRSGVDFGPDDTLLHNMVFAASVNNGTIFNQ